MRVVLAWLVKWSTRYSNKHELWASGLLLAGWMFYECWSLVKCPARACECGSPMESIGLARQHTTFPSARHREQTSSRFQHGTCKWFEMVWLVECVQWKINTALCNRGERDQWSDCRMGQLLHTRCNFNEQSCSNILGRFVSCFKIKFARGWRGHIASKGVENILSGCNSRNLTGLDLWLEAQRRWREWNCIVFPCNLHPSKIRADLQMERGHANLLIKGSLLSRHCRQSGLFATTPLHSITGAQLPSVCDGMVMIVCVCVHSKY